MKKYYEKGILPEDEYIWKIEEEVVKPGFCKKTASLCCKCFSSKREKNKSEIADSPQ